MTAEGSVEAEISGRRVRADRLHYRARSERLEVSSLTLEGGLAAPSGLELGAPSLLTARRSGRGGVATARARRTPPTARLGAPWLEAAEAEIKGDLSWIRGRRGVRIGAGAITIGGAAFDLDPAHARLEVDAPVVRLHEPRCRIEAARLLAHDTGGATPEIVLEGRVVARLSLPLGPRAKNVVFEAHGDRLVVRRGKIVEFTLTGAPARIVVPSARGELASGSLTPAPGRDLALEAPEIRGRIPRRGITLEGAITGRITVSASAFPERRAARRAWTITGARSIAIKADQSGSGWLAGPDARRPERVVVEGGRLLCDGGAGPVEGRRIELFRPTWPT